MADPLQNLPTAIQFVPRGPTPYGNPGVPVPVVPPVNNFVPRVNPAQQGYATGNPPVLPRLVPAVATAQPASNVMAGMGTPPAPAVPVAPPAAAVQQPAVAAGTDQSAGVPNNVVLPPLPANMRAALNADGTGPAGTPPLPGGGGTVPVVGGGSTGTAAAGPALQTPRGFVPLPPAPQFAGGGAAAAQAGGGTDDGAGLQVIRGGAVTNYDSGGNVAFGPSGSIAPRGSGLQDPQGVINAGFDTQTARAENFIQQAMDYVNAGGNIFDRATRGRFVNGLLQATVGPNNVGQVQGQGQDTLNSAIAGESEAATSANASIFGSEANYAGNVNRDTTALQLEQQQRANTVTPIGTQYVDNGMGIKVPVPINALPSLDTNGSPTGYRVINPSTGMVRPAPAKPSVTDFISNAKKAGSTATDTELRNYYDQTYGQ
jgi:hypothetical protein